jgi:hypothetical protein
VQHRDADDVAGARSPVAVEGVLQGVRAGDDDDRAVILLRRA